MFGMPQIVFLVHQLLQAPPCKKESLEAPEISDASLEEIFGDDFKMRKIYKHIIIDYVAGLGRGGGKGFPLREVGGEISPIP